LYLSIVFALLVALLWAATLSLTFVIIKVLLQGESLQSFLANEIRSAETAIAGHDRDLRDLDRRLAELTYGTDIPATPTGLLRSKKELELLQRQDRIRTKLSADSKRLVLYQWIQRHVISWIPSDQFDTYSIILVILLVATLVKGAATFVQEVLVGSVVELTVMSLRKDCFRHLLDLDYQTLARHGKPDLMSRFTNDIGIVADGLNLLGGKVIREPLKAVACIGTALFFNWRLTLLSLICVPLMGMAFHRYGKQLKRASHHMMDRMSRIYKSLEETLDGLKIVIAFNGERRHRQRFHREHKEYYHTAMKVVNIDALTGPTIEFFMTFGACVALLPGAYLVLRQTDAIRGIKLASDVMQIEDLSVLYALLAGTLDPLRKLSSVYAKLKRVIAATQRVFEIMQWQPLLKQVAEPQAMPHHSESIVFKKVTFKYAVSGLDKERPNALSDITLKITAGEVVVVVGENGSGKSTLVNLLPRYYDPDSGAVLIDGVDIRNVRLRDLRAQIGVVTQETLLFDDTIYENIRYGKPDATHAEILAAAEQAHVPQFFDQLPEGFSTRVGPRGGRLSGGQRQRVALARALLRNPTILILDEATSAVDAQSESMIHQCLGEFVKGRTVFLITHAVTPKILEFATKIVVMEHGQVIAAGPHNELLQSCAAYQALFHAQTAGRTSDSAAVFRLDPAVTSDTDADEPADNTVPHVIKFAAGSSTSTSESESLEAQRKVT
jgi:subfamily B ATP-binding cassette protein MsbA